mgnify:CR=1 FL=1|jgi:hypothetical protein
MAQGKRRGLHVDKSSLNGVFAKMQNIAEVTNRRTLRRLRKGAEDVKQLAVKYAPVEDHNIEQSIDIEETREGRNRRTVIKVFVNPSKGNTGTVEKYYLMLHESTYKLGEDSIEKQKGQSEKVGNKFLERAVDDSEVKIRAALFNTIKAALR